MKDLFWYTRGTLEVLDLEGNIILKISTTWEEVKRSGFDPQFGQIRFVSEQGDFTLEFDELMELLNEED